MEERVVEGEAVERVETRVSMSLDIQVSHADCRIKGDRKTFGRGSDEVIGLAVT